ncbi:MAG: ribonuclease III, partial [Polyangiaceae bacterium]
ESRAALATLLEGLLGSPLTDGERLRLDEALTHPSFANEAPTRDNQRLEFLGDAVLGLCVSEILILAQPDADEGLLTRMRASLVNAEALARWARASGVGSAIAFGRGARSGSEREQTNVLADAVEAVVAAVYSTRGLEGARAIVRNVVGSSLDDAQRLAMPDPKSALQELVQGQRLPTPVYRLVETRGPQRDAVFVVDVSVGERTLGRGEGRSKRNAERAAAEEALRTLASETPAP